MVADKRSLHQIMLNLMSNAIKFTKSGGKVRVSARVDDGCIAVVVEDTGVGIGAEDLPRIGDPFFQARSSYDRRHDGTGLGLSIVKGLLALHGGRMEIASRLGEGTRVTIRLPLDCEAARRRGEISSIGRLTTKVPDKLANDRVRISA
jgi:cell cycle sensor histidine kinase DivJ